MQSLIRVITILLFVILLRRLVHNYKVKSRLRAIRKKEPLGLEEILAIVLAEFSNIKTWADFKDFLPVERLIDITDTPAVRRMNRVSGQGDEVGFKNHVFQFQESPNHYGVLDVDFLFDRLVNVRIQIIITRAGRVESFMESARSFIKKEADVDLTVDYLPNSIFNYSGPMGEDLVIGLNKLPNSISITVMDKEIALKY